jgi:hypothetical protein
VSFAWKNRGGFQLESVIGAGPDGRPGLTVIAKGTWDFKPGEPCRQAENPLPVFLVDENEDGNPRRPLRFENDLAPFKPRTDVVLIGTAHSPGRRAVTEMTVGLRIAHLAWALRVTGNREWSYGSRLSLVPSIGIPGPFIDMPVSYERSFGGLDEAEGEIYTMNPAGTGFAARLSPQSIHRKSLPNIEGVRDVVKSWNSRPRPAGFGFYSRGWGARLQHAGLDPETGAAVSPFRFDYYNAAHPELQVDGYLKGDEEVEILNLTPAGRLTFRLPGIRPVVRVTRTVERNTTGALPADPPGGSPPLERVPVTMNLDTLCLLPDEGRLYLVWRGIAPVRNHLADEVQSISVYSDPVRPAGREPGEEDFHTTTVFTPWAGETFEATSQVVYAEDLEKTCRNVVFPGAPETAPAEGADDLEATRQLPGFDPSESDGGPPRTATPASPAPPAPATPLAAAFPGAAAAAGPRPAPRGAPREGERIGDRYVLERLIARRRSAAVWLARDTAADTPVAIKILADLLARDPETADNVKRAAARSARLNHPGIARTLEFLEDGPVVAIVMEYAAGRTLASIRNEAMDGCLEPGEILPWIAGIGAALDYAHLEAGQVHRDLKPENIIIDSENRVKLTDFGVAVALNEHHTRRTGVPTAGSLTYMSPQQLMGEKPRPSDDIYSLGATLFHVLAGKPPFYASEIMDQVFKDESPRVSERRLELGIDADSIPPEWDDAIAACLAKDAGARPASAGRLGQVLAESY